MLIPSLHSFIAEPAAPGSQRHSRSSYVRYDVGNHPWMVGDIDGSRCTTGSNDRSTPSGAKAEDRGFSIGDESSFSEKLRKGGPATLGAGITGGVLLYGLAGMAKSQPKASARNMGYRGTATFNNTSIFVAVDDAMRVSDCTGPYDHRYARLHRLPGLDEGDG